MPCSLPAFHAAISGVVGGLPVSRPGPAVPGTGALPPPPPEGPDQAAATNWQTGNILQDGLD